MSINMYVCFNDNIPMDDQVLSVVHYDCPLINSICIDYWIEKKKYNVLV